MSETPVRRTRLLVEHTPPNHPAERASTPPLTAADGVVIHAERYPDPAALDLDTGAAALVCDDAAPCAGWRERHGLHWACAGGLERTARLRDDWPQLPWLPRLTVYKPSLTYRFSNEFDGEGFKFYRPDTAAIRGYQVTDGDVALQAALERAKELAFETVWLHAVDAELLAFGLDLDMLERARAGWDGALWISGGAASVKHLENLAREGGAAAVVVPEVLASRCGCEALRAALEPPPSSSPAEAPIRFAGAGGVGHGRS